MNSSFFEKGNYVTDKQTIFRRYMKEHFLVDMLALFPNLLSHKSFTKPSITMVNPQIWQLVVYLKIGQFNRNIKQIEVFMNFQDRQRYVYDLIKLIFMQIFICHVFAFLWHGIGLLEEHDLHLENNWRRLLNL